MSTLLAKIQIHPGRESEFEEVMAYMYRETHRGEAGVLRYEYWRGREPNFYYCLLSFRDTLTFWRHQASDHHEGQMQRFSDCIAHLDLEVVDPVSGSAPLPATQSGDLPAFETEIVREQAALFPIELAQWWLELRKPKSVLSEFLVQSELEAGLDHIRGAPAEEGCLEMIVSRPSVGERVIHTEGVLDATIGLIGDNWHQRGYRKGPDGAAHPDMQLNIMNARSTALIAGPRERWPLAGDQLYVDLDISDQNLPPGTHLRLGEATIEVTAEPHLGCKKFVERFGRDAMLFVNSDIGKALNLRGINAKVIEGGAIAVGDTVSKC